MSSTISALASFLMQFEIEILVVIALAILGAVAKIIRRYLRYVYYSIIDKQIRIKIHLDQEINGSLVNPLDAKIFDELKQQLKDRDVVRKITANPHFVEISSENLGMNITASLDADYDYSESAEAEQTTILCFNLVIKHNAEIKGFRRNNDVHDFVILATRLSQIIDERCFEKVNEKGNKLHTYVICDVKDFIREPITKNLLDKKTNAEISIHDKILTIKTSEPNDLAKLLSKYLRELSS